jgi:hypothetical protein
MNELIETSVAYDDVDAIKAALVGRRIIETRKGKQEEWYRGPLDTIEFVLDDGTILEARETDGGCACSNGCWSVESVDAAPTQVITNVEAVEELDDNGYTTHGDGTATLRLFVYADQVKAELVKSVGGDNGYYGWGYELVVKRPAVQGA